jgi:hypothetical protein
MAGVKWAFRPVVMIAVRKVSGRQDSNPRPPLIKGRVDKFYLINAKLKVS